MIFHLYSIRDELSGFLTPVIEQNDAIAMRNFRMACSSAGNSLMSWRPSDFSLYCLATFDSLSGAVVPLNPIEIVCRGEKNEVSDSV